MLKFLVLAGVLILLFGGATRLLMLGGAKSLNGADRILGGDRGTVLLASGLAYGPGPANRLDIWAPAGTGPDARLPVIVFFYGGGWHSGARADYGFVGRSLAAAGFLVVIPDYRLVPAAKWPDFLEDSAAATAWVRRNIAAHGGDPERIALAGHSAGAYNAAMLALDPQWLAAAGESAAHLRGVAALAGPFDFLPLEAGGSAAKAMGHVRPLARTQPINYVRGDAPPMWLASGADDTTVLPRNSIALANAVRAAGGDAAVVSYVGMGHSGIIMALAQPFEGRSAVRDDLIAWATMATARRIAPVSPLPPPPVLP